MEAKKYTQLSLFPSSEPDPMVQVGVTIRVADVCEQTHAQVWRVCERQVPVREHAWGHMVEEDEQPSVMLAWQGFLQRFVYGTCVTVLLLLVTVLRSDMPSSPLPEASRTVAVSDAASSSVSDETFHTAASVEIEVPREELPMPIEESLPMEETPVAEILPGGSIPAKPDTERAIYLTANSINRKDFYEETLEQMEKNGITSLVFEAKAGVAHFETDSVIAHTYGFVDPIPDLAKIIREAKARGIFVIARFVAVRDPLVSERIPETRIKYRETGNGMQGGWVDAAHPMVLEYNRQLIRDLLKLEVDEINLDYIRYPTDYPRDAITLDGQGKADHLEAFIKMARETINEVRPQTKLGLSTYAILGWGYKKNVEALGQDVARFAPLVDIISPMAYPSTFTSEGYYVPGRDKGPRAYWLVYRTLTGYQEVLGPEQGKKLRPWIQGYYITSADMQKEIQAVYDAGLCGFLVWNAQNEYAVTYKAVKNGPAVPVGCTD